MTDLAASNAAFAARQIRGATIAWGGGAIYDFERPNPEVISLEDAAYALAFTVRWRGQSTTLSRSWWRRLLGRPGVLLRAFYGVGQHVVFGAEEMMREGYDRADALAFLWHEDDEVVLPDFPGPVKPLLPGFRPLARLQGEAIQRRFGIGRPSDPGLIKRWDMRMMVTEKRDLMAGHEGDWFQTSEHKAIDDNLYEPFARRIVPYRHPEEAAWRFIELHNRLTA